MFTSRGPINRGEIEACVAWYRHSPLWTPSSLTEADMVDCLEELMSLGVAVIDIVENSELEKDLKKPSKALALKNSHYQYGFVHVTFYCYVRLEVIQRILTREDDTCDPFLYFIELYHAYKSDPRLPRPIPRLDSDRRIMDDSMSMLSCNIYHSDIASQLTLKHLKYFSYKDEFMNRVYRSVEQFSIGYKHDVVMHACAGSFHIGPIEKSGLKMARQFSGNADRPNYAKKYVFCCVRNQNIAEQLGLSGPEFVPDVGMHTRYTYMFLDHRLKRRAGLTKLQQQICNFLMVGYSYEQVAQFCDKEEYESLKATVTQLEAQLAACAKSDPTYDRLEKRLNRNKYALANLPNRFRNAKRMAAEGLESAQLLKRPFTEDNLVRNLLSNGRLAHEIREFTVPVYPWPEDLPSRRM